jgi:hypothetical protein
MGEGTAAPRGAATRWAYGTTVPERYTANYPRYTQFGGLLSPEEIVAGFTAGGENRGDMARFFSFCLIFDQIVKEGVNGDFAELGVYKGHTATLLAAMARKLGRTAFLLDTFAGFPREDLAGIDAGAAPDAFRDTSLASVRAFVGDANVRYVEGYFPATAGQLPVDRDYCLVHVDCDLYASIDSALRYFYPRMAPGGFIVVHDYSSLHWLGAEKAVDEFFADKPEAPVPLPDSAGSVVVRKARAGNAASSWIMRQRAAVLGGDWMPAGNGALHALLGQGWSIPEDWGVWGVGDAHELHLVLPRPLPEILELDLDVHAVLAGRRTTQQVDVVLGGNLIEAWEFARQDNRRVRRLRIPGAAMDGLAAEYASATLLFKPRATESPRELSSELNDDRPLGMALNALRARRIAARR